LQQIGGPRSRLRPATRFRIFRVERQARRNAWNACSGTPPQHFAALYNLITSIFG